MADHDNLRTQRKNVLGSRSHRHLASGVGFPKKGAEYIVDALPTPALLAGAAVALPVTVPGVLLAAAQRKRHACVVAEGPSDLAAGIDIIGSEITADNTVTLHIRNKTAETIAADVVGRAWSLWVFKLPGT